MASASPNVAGIFAVGTSVSAYAQSNWQEHQLPPSGSPKGSAAATATVSAAGVAAFTGLAANTRYFVTNATGTRYVSFSTHSTVPLAQQVAANTDPVFAPSVVPSGASNPTLTASRAYYGKFIAPRTMTVNTIGFVVVTAAGTDDACDVGLYDSSGTRLVSAGATTGKLNATGIKTVAIAATTLSAGETYYTGFSCGTFGGSAAVVGGMTPAGGVDGWKILGTGAGTILAAAQASAHPLPAAFGTLIDVTQQPMMSLREA